MLVKPILRMFGIDARHLSFRYWQRGTLANHVAKLWGTIRTNYGWQRALIGWSCASRRPQRNFLILSAARSGTTLLVDYLNCHERIRCRGEILNADYACYGNPKRMSRERLKLHVEAMFARRANTSVGAKVLTYQLDELPLKLSDLLDVLNNPMVIVLYRESLVEQYVSLKTAERNKVWHSARHVSQERIRLDPVDFVAFAQRERRMWRENLAALSNTPVHFLTYELLAGSTATAMRGVFSFLGLDACPVQSPLVKLNPGPLSGRLVNHADFLSANVRCHSILRLPLLRESPIEHAA